MNLPEIVRLFNQLFRLFDEADRLNKRSHEIIEKALNPEDPSDLKAASVASNCLTGLDELAAEARYRLDDSSG